ncbi:MAG: hypothetical protein MJ072_06685, partial [Clostridia bacterium]|nr:hypothetical protein [Clostridia bacterium]
MNILPANKAKTPNYFCTWETQNILSKKCGDFIGDHGAKYARLMMNAENVFGENGMARIFDENLRADLFFVLDDGWDVGYGIHPDENRDKFGSLIADGERFNVSGSPQDKLKYLSDKIKEFGWKGLGVWVSPQQAKGLDRTFDYDAFDEEYWRERLLWSKYAGVSYWKVDWGQFDHDLSFRKKLTLLARSVYPELIVEHAVPEPPLNGFDGE